MILAFLDLNQTVIENLDIDILTPFEVFPTKELLDDTCCDFGCL